MKTIKKISFLLSILLLSLASCAQKPKREIKNTDIKVLDTTYTIGNYQFNPTKKSVSVLQHFSEGKVGTAMGYFPDQSIKYDSTTLVVLGNEIIFKEHLPKEVDFASLHYIGESDYGVNLFSDKQYIFIYSANFLNFQGPSKKLDVSAYNRINDYVYENKNGEIFFLNAVDGLKLSKIDPSLNVDKHTLKHLQGQYFADKNGLYAFGIRWFGTKYSKNFSQQPIDILVESAKGKIIKPTITRNYIVYGNSVYAKGYSIEKLKLDVDKMIELQWRNQNIYFITDGTNLYENRHSNYDESGWNKNNDYANDFFKSGINILKIFSADIKFLQAKDKSTLYFTNIKRDKTIYTEKNGVLIKTDKGYYFANFSLPNVKPEKIDKIVIYNQNTKQNEDFDDGEYLNIEERIFAYKGNIFINNIPVKEVNAAKRIQIFTQNGIKTNFATTDRLLIAFGNFGGYQITMINGEERVVFDDHIKTGIDFTKLKAVNKNLLVDEENFYDCSNGSLQVIPFKKLGMPVKLLLPTEPKQYDF